MIGHLKKQVTDFEKLGIQEKLEDFQVSSLIMYTAVEQGLIELKCNYNPRLELGLDRKWGHLGVG